MKQPTFIKGRRFDVQPQTYQTRKNRTLLAAKNGALPLPFQTPPPPPPHSNSAVSLSFAYPTAGQISNLQIANLSPLSSQASDFNATSQAIHVPSPAYSARESYRKTEPMCLRSRGWSSLLKISPDSFLRPSGASPKLSLPNNHLIRRLPPQIVDCSKIEIVDLPNNQFSGYLSLIHLRVLNLSLNRYFF